uniref:Uncharacterized protein n=1 Tax=Anopheles farauti TaxID=69004 RepID=A0A182Q4M0_9DIPT
MPPTEFDYKEREEDGRVDWPVQRLLTALLPTIRRPPPLTVGHIVKGACPASAPADPDTTGTDDEPDPIVSAPDCRPVEEADEADDDDDVGDEREAAGEDPNPNPHTALAAAAAGGDR